MRYDHYSWRYATKGWHIVIKKYEWVEIEFHAFPLIFDGDERSAPHGDCSNPAERNLIPTEQDAGWQRRNQVLFGRLGWRPPIAARNRNYENETNRNYLLNFLCFSQCFRFVGRHLFFFFFNISSATHLGSAVWNGCTTRPSLATSLLGGPQSWLGYRVEE